MKKYAKPLFIVLLFLTTGVMTSAQQKSYFTQLSLGVSAPLLDSGWGVHLGANPSYRLLSWCSAEAQFSYLYSRVTSSFLSGRKTHLHSINLLGGARIYLNAENKKHRYFINALLGLNRVREIGTDVVILPEVTTGLSAGFFYTKQKLVTGICLETPQNIIVKAGFRF